VKIAVVAIVIHVLLLTVAPAQTSTAPATAAESIQLSQTTETSPQSHELKIPAGTPLEIGCAYTVSSLDVRPEDLISFRLLVPVRVNGVTVIEKDSLVTGRVIEAKRGGHWGKAGKLSWIMLDVVATDLTRVPVDARSESYASQSRITGTSHGGQVAAQIAIAAPLMLFAAPVALMAGFKRGENAVLPEGKRFIVFVKSDTIVHASERRIDE
jgi:hypothetical protein